MCASHLVSWSAGGSRSRICTCRYIECVTNIHHATSCRKSVGAHGAPLGVQALRERWQQWPALTKQISMCCGTCCTALQLSLTEALGCRYAKHKGQGSVSSFEGRKGQGQGLGQGQHAGGLQGTGVGYRGGKSVLAYISNDILNVCISSYASQGLERVAVGSTSSTSPGSAPQT